jgi:hypothetical protein
MIKIIQLVFVLQLAAIAVSARQVNPGINIALNLKIPFKIMN